MIKSSIRILFGTIVLAAMASGCAEYGHGRKAGGTSAGNESPATAGAVPATGPNRAAAGHAGDTLEACLARIPKDASAGQRMLAEKSCERDHANRKPIDQVPGQ